MSSSLFPFTSSFVGDSASVAASRFLLRSLASSDFDAGVTALLSQLTTCGDVTAAMFQAHFEAMQRAGNYHIVVIEDTSTHTLVGTATLLTELKFTHACGKVGHVEDVVADASCRGQGFGKILILALLDVARSLGCYKVILDANEKNTGFYEKCGFTRRELQMRIDL
jgi:glucosamine-phosphate N-acetyltransferase